MAGDYTKFSFKHKKNYSDVYKQQGRVSLDSDWNELSEITDRRWRSETIDIIGKCVVPNYTPDGFLVIPTGVGAFNIGIGRAYVDGIQAECHGLDPQLYDAVLGEEQGTRPVPYNDQPHLPAPLPSPLSSTGETDLIYLDVWRREVTVIEDPGIKEIALGGPDTMTRVQTAWQVKAITDVDDVLCTNEIQRWDDETRPSGGSLLHPLMFHHRMIIRVLSRPWAVIGALKTDYTVLNSTHPDRLGLPGSNGQGTMHQLWPR